MKKVFFTRIWLFLCAFLFGSTALTKSKPALSLHVKQDKHFPSVYYNTHTFPQGLFTTHGKTLLAESNLMPALIAWDINGVLFKKEYSIPHLMYQLAVTEKYGWIFTFKALASFTRLMRYKKQLKQQHDPRGWVFEAMFKELEKSPREKQYVPLLRKFTTQVNRVNYTSIALLQDLETTGHTNVLLSNMGQGLIDAIVTSLEAQATHPILSSRKKEALSFTITFISNSKRHVIAASPNKWLHKPLRKSYLTCIEKNQSFPRQVRILLDDKVSNITAGLRDGLFDIGILFTNATEVRTIFKHLQILTSPSQ